MILHIFLQIFIENNKRKIRTYKVERVLVEGYPPANGGKYELGIAFDKTVIEWMSKTCDINKIEEIKPFNYQNRMR